MIFIKEREVSLLNPSDYSKLNIVDKNYIYDNLKLGYLIFTMPKTYDLLHKQQKKEYKIGFLYDLLSTVYHEMSVEFRYKIISDKYHLFITYRQFRTLLINYEKSKDKYYKRPDLL